MEFEKSQENAMQVHLADYENCNKRIEQCFSMQAQLMNIVIAVIGGVVAVGNNPSIQSPSIFIIGSLVMAFLCWALADISMQLAGLYEYIETKLIPKIQKLVGRDQPLEFKVLVGEKRAYKWYILAGGKHALSYIAGISFLLFFLYQKSLLRQELHPLELIGCMVSPVLMLVPPINGFVWLIRVNKLKKLREKKNSQMNDEVLGGWLT